jgi:hypothetical protein
MLALAAFQTAFVLTTQSKPASIALRHAHPVAVASWYDAGLRLANEEKWPAVGGKTGPHRMAGTMPIEPPREQWEPPSEWPGVVKLPAQPSAEVVALEAALAELTTLKAQLEATTPVLEETGRLQAELEQTEKKLTAVKAELEAVKAKLNKAILNKAFIGLGGPVSFTATVVGLPFKVIAFPFRTVGRLFKKKWGSGQSESSSEGTRGVVVPSGTAPWKVALAEKELSR